MESLLESDMARFGVEDGYAEIAQMSSGAEICSRSRTHVIRSPTSVETQRVLIHSFLNTPWPPQTLSVKIRSALT